MKLPQRVLLQPDSWSPPIMRGGGNKGYFYESRTKSGINRKNSTDKFNPDCSFPVE